MNRKLHPVFVVVAGTLACACFGCLIVHMTNRKPQLEALLLGALIGGGIGAILFAGMELIRLIFENNETVREYTRGGFAVGLTLGVVVASAAFLYDLIAQGWNRPARPKGDVYLIGLLGAAVGFLLGAFVYLYRAVARKLATRPAEPLPDHPLGTPTNEGRG